MMMRALGWNVLLIRISSMGGVFEFVKTRKRRDPHRSLLFPLRSGGSAAESLLEG
jgi:hypothetical protein